MDNIHQEDILCTSLFFKDIPQDILDYTNIKYPYNSKKYTPKLTGIPPHILVMVEFEELRYKFKELYQSIKMICK